jgi:asparagine synthase (glutamine-hydrolysing)
MVVAGRDDRVIDPDMLARLNLDEFIADSYAQGLAEVPTRAGDDPTQRRMREALHLHISRFMPFLLDRKDRISMAVGLEIRVPYCDHRLVEYLFNIPWRMQCFDGREKSILRAVGRELLPASILYRKKQPYPSAFDLRYENILRDKVAEVMADRAHPSVELLNRRAVTEILTHPRERHLPIGDRLALERVRSLALWLEDREIEVAA